MSDQTIRNISELEKALEASHLKRERETSAQPQDSPISTQPNTPTAPWPGVPHQDIHQRVHSPAPSSSKDRTSTYQYSSNQLLINLCGLQTTTNSKVDILTDSILRLNKTMEGIAEEQRKHTELLVRIMQNTAEPIRATSEPTSSTGKSSTQMTRKCADYGFTNVNNVLSEFILQLLKQAEIQIKAHNKGYRSSRTMERRMLDKAVSVLCAVDYKVDGVTKPKVNLPATSSESCVYLASKIGSTDSIKPIMTPQHMVQLFNDPNCRTMISAVEEIMWRLKAIRWMIPYYEADIVNALTYPYFDDDGKVMCNWELIQPRSETQTEARIMSAKIGKREMLGKLVVQGIKFDKALSMALRET